MTPNPEDPLELLRRIRMDLTNAQAKLTDATNYLAALNLPPPSETRCPTCEIRLRGPLALAEHLYNSHGGPLPAHWRRAEQLAGLDDEPPPEP